MQGTIRQLHRAERLNEQGESRRRRQTMLVLIQMNEGQRKIVRDFDREPLIDMSKQVY
jgi:hypothetical protein